MKGTFVSEHSTLFKGCFDYHSLFSKFLYNKTFANKILANTRYLDYIIYFNAIKAFTCACVHDYNLQSDWLFDENYDEK